jgi:hypothetical protein
VYLTIWQSIHPGVQASIAEQADRVRVRRAGVSR